MSNVDDAAVATYPRSRSRKSGRSSREGLAEKAAESTIRVITTRRIIYWLAAMVVLLIVGTTIGLIWADTSNVAGAFAGITNVIGVVGIVLLLIALGLKRRRRAV
jgi:membrane protein YdbS with pleckstrin-like domain